MPIDPFVDVAEPDTSEVGWADLTPPAPPVSGAPSWVPAGPQDLGLGAPPTRPVPMPLPQMPAHPDFKNRLLTLIAAGVGAGLGPHRGGTGLLAGSLAAQRQAQILQQQRLQQAQQMALRQEQIQQQQYRQDAQDYQEQLLQRQRVLQQTLGGLGASLKSARSPEDADKMVGMASAVLQSSGLTKYDPVRLQQMGFRYRAPDATEKAVDAFKNYLAVNRKSLEAPGFDPSQVSLMLDLDGDGQKEPITLDALAEQAGTPFGKDPNGHVLVYPKGTTTELKANADGILAQLVEADKTMGRPMTPGRMVELQQQAIKKAKEAGDLGPNAADPTLAALREVNLQLAQQRLDDAKAGKTSARDRFSIQPVTNPDGTTSIVRVNLETGQATPIDLPSGVAGAGRPNEGAGKTAEFLPRVEEADKIANGFESDIEKLGTQMSVQLPNLLRSPKARLYRNAQDEFINAGLRDESGAAIQPSEYERYRKIYFAEVGDDAATLAQKRQARQRVIDGLRLRAGNLAAGSARRGVSQPASSPAEEWTRDPVTGKLTKKGLRP